MTFDEVQHTSTRRPVVHRWRILMTVISSFTLPAAASGAEVTPAADDNAIRPFHVSIPQAALDDLRRRIARHAVAREGDRDRSSQGVQLATMQRARALLGDGLRLAQGRGETERAAAVHHRDRRAGHPLHPRPLETQECAAARGQPRLARLDHRAVEDHRSAGQSHGARRPAHRTHSTS